PAPSEVLKTPPIPVPAYRIDESVVSIARVLTSGSVRPLFIGTQLRPPSVVLKIPPAPIYKIEGLDGSMATALATMLVILLQVAPPSALLYRPPLEGVLRMTLA